MMSIRERAARQGAGAVHLPRPAAAPDEGRLRAWVERLAVPRHVFANPQGNAAARRQLADAFERLGLSVQLQGRYQNVVALPRRASAGPLTLIAAHYDSVPDCPGADDNASGLAVMLECARALSSTNASAPIGFIAFNAEEDGLLGSRDFVTHGLPSLALQLRDVHVLEMVGFRSGAAATQRLPLPWITDKLRRPDFIGLLAKGASNEVVDHAVASRAAPGLRLLAAKTWGPLHRLLPDLSRSDHFPFWEAGMSAVMWTDTANFRNPNYHRLTDTPDTLDYAFMQQVAELLCAVVSPDPVPPRG